MNTIKETLETPVRYACDVCVCGGGVAGIAAALAARRAGADVLLLERGFILGGLATAGLVTIYLPLCDGEGTQVSFGLAEELLKLSIEHGIEDRNPVHWFDDYSQEERKNAERYEVQFNAQLFAVSAEQQLLKEGVKILYGVTAVAVQKENDKITTLVIEGKSGREAISVGKSVVDCTGDADICVLSGEKTRLHGEGNVLAAWYYGFAEGKYALTMCGLAPNPPKPEDGTVLPQNRRYAGVDTEEITEFMVDSHASMLNHILNRRKETPDLLPVTMATTPQFRMTRCIEGVSCVDITADHKRVEDSVGLFSNWRKRGPVYELPYTTLYGKNIKNLITAGRCTCASDAMWDLTRVIPVCAVSGEAAGLAAAMTDDFAALPVAALQDRLVKNGVKLHL